MAKAKDVTKEEKIDDVDEDLEDKEDFDGDAEPGDAAEIEDDAPDENPVTEDEVNGTEDDEEELAEPPARPHAGDEEDDDEEVDPDDVEADLDTILKDRLASPDEDEEDDEDEAPQTGSRKTRQKIVEEFICEGCFLLVTANQFGPANDMRCPNGEEVCPAMEQLKA